MVISIGADHAGVNIRTIIIQILEEKKINIIDHGTKLNLSVDYPDFAYAVGNDVAFNRANYGILICNTGIGMSIVANKVKGVRAALVNNSDSAFYCRKHNNANVLCIGSKYQNNESVKHIVNTFLKTKFEKGRHVKRINKILNIDFYKK